MKDENKLAQILKCCERIYGYDSDTTIRLRSQVLLRASYSYAARKYTKISYKKIGNLIKKDHATVMNYFKNTIQYHQEDGFTNKLKQIFIECEFILNTNTDEVLDHKLISYLSSRVSLLEYKNNKLKEMIFVDKIPKKSDDFIEEIRNLEPEVKREFKEYRWKPFKRLLETRVKH
jgi:hypothetical protein